MATDKERFVRYLRPYIYVALAVSLGVSIVYFAFPPLQGFLVDEDRLLETVSALLDLGVFVYGLALTIRGARDRGIVLSWPLFMALVGLWSFLEDMSYGQRIFGFDSPRVFGVPIDGLHDFAYVGKRYLDILIKYQARRLVVLVAVLSLVALGLLVRYRRQILALALKILRMPPYLFFAIYVLLMVPSALLDLDMFASSVTTLIEEVMEFSASLALLWSCIATDSLRREQTTSAAGSTARRGAR